MMNRSGSVPLFGALTLLLGFACTSVRKPTVEDLDTGQILTEFEQVERTGTRDGDRLPAQIRLEATGSRLILSLQFRIGVPTTLTGGTYAWEHAGRTLQGSVRARSLTFLGGQSDNPNLGGVFELVDESGTPAFKVVVPTGEVRR